MSPLGYSRRNDRYLTLILIKFNLKGIETMLHFKLFQ